MGMHPFLWGLHGPLPFVHLYGQPRWLSGLRRSHVHSLMIAHRSLCPEKLGSNPSQGSRVSAQKSGRKTFNKIKLVRAVKGLISRAGMVSICPLL